MTPPDAPLSLAYAEPDWQTVHSAWAEHLPAAFWLIETLRPSRLVELGTHAGDSYCAFCQAIKALGLHQATTAMAVDTWEGDEHSERYGDAIYKALSEYHAPVYGSFSQLNQTLFEKACAETKDGSVDLLHIDGLHTYEAVKADFESWLPKMSARGVVLFHDVAERKDDFGVWKLWDEVTPHYAHLLLPHGHGLGILAVGSDVPAGFTHYLTAAGQSEVSPKQQALIQWLAALGRGCELRRLELVALNDAARIQADHDTLLMQYHSLENAIAYANEELAKTHASISWKLTAPLRAIRGVLKAS